MKRLAQLLSLAFIISMIGASSADARSAAKASKVKTKSNVSAKQSAKASSASSAVKQAAHPRSAVKQSAGLKVAISSQKASALIRAKLSGEGKETVISRKTESHAKMTEHVAMVIGKYGKKSFVKLQVMKDGSVVRKAGGKVTPKQAQEIAHLLSRRERGPNKGSFAGVIPKNVTAKSYIFGSKTDANERIEVAINPNKNGTIRARKVETKAN